MAFEGETPEGWETKPLRKLMKEVKSRVDPKRITLTTDTKYLGLEHIDQGSGTLIGIGVASTVTSMKTTFRAGDALFGKLRPNLHKIARPAFDGICSTDILAFRATPDTDPEFLFYLLSSEAVYRCSVDTAVGTKMPRTNSKALLDFETKVPPLAEQKKIAEILAAVDDIIAKTKAVEAAIFQTSQAALDQLLDGKSSYDTSEWRMARCEDVCHAIKVGIASAATHAFADTGVPLIRNQNIKDGWLDRAEFLFVTEEYDAENRTKRVRAGDIVTMRTGYPGRSAVVPVDLDNCQTFTTLVSRPDKSVVTSEYLCMWYNSAKGRRLITSLQAGGAQQNLNAGVLKRMPILVPPLKIQEELAELDKISRKARDDAKRQLERLSTLKAGLMTDLLSGRIRVVMTTTSAEIIPFPSRPATLAAYICKQHQGEVRFGSQKLQKILHFCQYEAVSGRDFSRTPQRQRAGPYDPDGRRKIAAEMQQQKWFREGASDGATAYEPLSELPKHAEVYKNQFSAEERASIDRIVSLLKPLTTDECGVYATLYASWNDFLISGHEPNDDKIIEDVMTNWAPEKASTPRREWKAGLKWLRNNNLVPKGVDPKTTRSGGQGFLF